MPSGKTSVQLCDVVLIAGPRRIPAHRLVLSAASDYFTAMFTSNVREATQDEVTLKDVDPEALSALVSFIYTGRSTRDASQILCQCSLLTFRHKSKANLTPAFVRVVHLYKYVLDGFKTVSSPVYILLTTNT